MVSWHVIQGRMHLCNSIQVNPTSPKVAAASYLPPSLRASFFFHHCISHRNVAVVPRTAEVHSQLKSWISSTGLVAMIWELLFSQLAGKG